MPRNRYFLPVLAALTLLLTVLIITDWLPALRGPAPGTSEWHWPYLLAPPERWAPLLAAGLIFLLLLAFWLLRAERGRPAMAAGLLGLVGGSLLFQLAAVHVHRPAVAAELVDRTLATETNGYFWTAATTADMGNLLRAFPAAMPTFVSEHARTHPPGLILANWLTIRVMDPLPALAGRLARLVWPQRCTDLWLLGQSPAVAAALGLAAVGPLLIGALAVIPAYFLGQLLFSPPGGRLAAALVATLPALLLMVPTPDQIYAALGLVALLAWHLGYRRQRGSLFFLAGLVLSLATFLSLGNAALALLFGLDVLLRWVPLRRGLEAPEHPVRCLALFGLGAATVWLLYWLGWGVLPWTVAQTGLAQHYTLVTSERRYSWWLLYNLLDLLIFAGPPLLAGFLLAVTGAVRRREIRSATASQTLTLSLFGLILLLDLSGSARGETGRLWLFLMPPLAVIAGGHFAHHWPGRRVALLIVSLQLILTMGLALAWQPIEAVIVVATPPDATALPASLPAEMDQRLDIRFDEAITLHGLDLEPAPVEPGESLAITLYWSADRPTERPYTVFTHLLDPNGNLVTQQDNWPVHGSWPSTCWEPDTPIADSYALTLPPDLSPGTYHLHIGLYDAETGGRLATDSGQDAISLPVRVGSATN